MEGPEATHGHGEGGKKIRDEGAYAEFVLVTITINNIKIYKLRKNFIFIKAEVHTSCLSFGEI